MKIFLSVDLEGISGVVHEEHTRRDGREHDRARRLMTGEANAAIAGALQAGAEEITVNDSHGTMRNIIPEELREEAKLITGSLKPLSMMQGIERGFDAAFFIGYHARRSTTRGILDHTYSGATVSDVQVNGRTLGETGLNAAIAGYHDVPVVLVTGDSAVTSEAKTLLGEVETVTVKEAQSRYSAKCLHPNKAREAIREGAISALRRKGTMRAFKIEPPIELKVEFMNSGMADQAELLPDATRTGPRIITYLANDYLMAHRAFRVMITLAQSAT